MNSSLQAIFGMKPFIDDIVNIFENSNIAESRGKYSSLLKKFIEVVKARRRGNQLQLNRNVQYVHVQLRLLWYCWFLKYIRIMSTNFNVHHFSQ